MFKRYCAQVTLYVVMILLITAVTASAQNLMVNPSFETGPTGGYPSSWLGYGNAAVERNSSPQYVAYDGSRLVAMFGNDSGPYNVSGVYQEFSSTEGDEWSLNAVTRHWSGDPMTGDASTGNYVVQRITFKDATDAELASTEAIILDGTAATDTWHVNTPITAIAPAGTAQVEAMVVYVQADSDGGEAHIDLVEFLYLGVVAVEESTWGVIKSLYE